MERENIIQQKSYDFAIRIVKAYKYIVEKKSEYVLSKQLIRSGTSIGANIEEAIGGNRPKTFMQKCQFRIKRRENVDFGFDY